MAKSKKPTPAAPSLMDFNEENLLENISLSNPGEDEDEEEEEDDSGLNPDGTIKQPKTAKRPKVKLPADEEEEEEEEEAPKPTKKKPAAPEPPPTPEPAEEEEEEEEEPPTADAEAEEFIQKVSAITGFDLEVDYGDVDPISPAGIALREQAVAEKAIADTFERIKERYPKTYRALEYESNGGNVEDLFVTEKDYSKVTIADDDEDHAKQVLDEYYQAKNVTNPDRRKRMIAAEAESEEGLVAAARSALAEMVEEQNRQVQSKLAAQQQQAEIRRQNDQKMVSSVSNLIKTGKLDSFKVPSQDATPFYEYVLERIQRDGKDGYQLVTPIEPAQLEKILQAEYFKYKKGDLNQLVQIKATTLGAKAIRARLGGKETSPKSTLGTPKTISSLQDLDF